MNSSRKSLIASGLALGLALSSSPLFAAKSGQTPGAPETKSSGAPTPKPSPLVDANKKVNEKPNFPALPNETQKAYDVRYAQADKETPAKGKAALIKKLDTKPNFPAKQGETQKEYDARYAAAVKAQDELEKKNGGASSATKSGPMSKPVQVKVVEKPGFPAKPGETQKDYDARYAATQKTKKG